jgi:hypothetical protein
VQLGTSARAKERTSVSFLRHEGIYRSDDFCLAGSEVLASLPALIGLDEFQPAIPWQVALQQSLPPLRRLRPILNNQLLPYNAFSANSDNPLNSVSQPKGAVHVSLFPCPHFLRKRPTKLFSSVAPPEFCESDMNRFPSQ